MKGQQKNGILQVYQTSQFFKKLFSTRKEINFPKNLIFLNFLFKSFQI